MGDRIVEEAIGCSVDADCDGKIGTGKAAEGAAYTAGLIEDLGVKVTLDVDLLRHPNNLLRTGANAEFASFTAIRFYGNARHRNSS